MLEWAEDDETVDSIRNKTALHFREGRQTIVIYAFRFMAFLPLLC